MIDTRLRLWVLCSARSVLDVGVFCLSHHKNRLTTPLRFGENHLRAVWRLSLGLGVVPAAAVFIWRLSMTNLASTSRTL